MCKENVTDPRVSIQGRLFSFMQTYRCYRKKLVGFTITTGGGTAHPAAPWAGAAQREVIVKMNAITHYEHRSLYFA